jgi:hypothetical protein
LEGAGVRKLGLAKEGKYAYDLLIEKNFHVSARVYKKAMLVLEREL